MQKNELVELFQWSLSFDDIVTQRGASDEERYRPAMEQQCQSLFVCLNQDVVGVVFEYLGFVLTKCGGHNTRPVQV